MSLQSIVRSVVVMSTGTPATPGSARMDSSSSPSTATKTPAKPRAGATSNSVSPASPKKVGLRL